MSHGQGPDTDEFDRLMALDDEAFQQEATGQQDGGEAPPPAQAAGTPPPEGSGGQGAPGDGGGDGGTTPAQPGATDLPADDWLAALPEEVRARVQQEREERAREKQEFEDRYNALHGRLAPTQRQLSEAQTRLAQMQQHRPAAQPSEAPPAQRAGQSLDSYFDSPGWKQWSEDFPGDAKVLRDGLEAQDRVWQEQLGQLNTQVQQLSQRLGQTEQVASRTVVNDEISRLESAHPDWRDLNNSDEFWSWFEDWKVTQPKSLRGQYYDAERLRELWCDSDFAIARINEYKASTAPTPSPAPTPTTVTPQTESAQPAPTPPRDPRLAMSVAPEVRGSAVPPAISTEGLSEAELFEHVWNQTP